MDNNYIRYNLIILESKIAIMMLISPIGIFCGFSTYIKNIGKKS